MDATKKLIAGRSSRNVFRMQTIKNVTTMQRKAIGWRQHGVRVGLVPTMGYLHEGHLSLVRVARRRVGKAGKVVVSVYVNPTQFGPREDLSLYPRDLARDLKLCRAEGVDVVFAPSDDAMYPGKAEGNYSTFVIEEGLSKSMEGGARPGHFRGVTTIVAKLFNIVQPDVAVFGAKDYQQAAVIRRMTRDLNFPLRIEVAPIVRESDGLAMSSRNKYLNQDLREQSIVLWRAIRKAQTTVKQSARSVLAARLKSILRELIEAQPAARVDYVEFFDPNTLKPVTKVCSGCRVALAVFVGKVRLIDNARL